MYEQHHYRVYEVCIDFLSFGVINSHSCNKSKRVIMIREKNTLPKSPPISALH